LALGIPGVSAQREYRRYYPTGEVAGHLLGFTNVDDEGQEGVELRFDQQLRGTPGSMRVVRDRLGRIVETVERLSEPVPGRDIALSIDRRIQYLAYRELKAAVQMNHAKAGSAVVLDVQTGEVLAMVNQPTFNPNNREGLRSERYRNRAVTDQYEPGSTVKPFTVAMALESGQYQPSTPIDTTPGTLRVGPNTIRDVHDYGLIDVSTVIIKSSNVGAGKLALALPAEQLWRKFTQVGLGSATGIDFPGEAGGSLPDYHRWYPIDRVTFSFGYGLSVSTLQLARAYAAIASGGVLKPVSLVPVSQPPAGERVMSEKIAQQLIPMLEGAASEKGTGGAARVAGYRVAGKTGTVRKSAAGGYAEDSYFSLFAGMIPASHPRLVMVVMINAPRGDAFYGGAGAAPGFGRGRAARCAGSTSSPIICRYRPCPWRHHPCRRPRRWGPYDDRASTHRHARITFERAAARHRGGASAVRSHRARRATRQSARADGRFVSRVQRPATPRPRIRRGRAGARRGGGGLRNRRGRTAATAAAECGGRARAARGRDRRTFLRRAVACAVRDRRHRHQRQDLVQPLSRAGAAHGGRALRRDRHGRQRPARRLAGRHAHHARRGEPARLVG